MKNLFLLSLLVILGCKNTPSVNMEKNAPKIVWDFNRPLNNAAQQLTKLDNQKFELTAGAETDFFIEPGLPPYEKANAPLLLKSVDNTQSFTFSVKITPTHLVKYDAGMAFLYVDDKQWLKFAFEADERMVTRLVTVKTLDVSDDNNHEAVKNPFVYLKISSDTKVVGFYYSTDTQTWQLVRVFKNTYPPVLWLGVGTQSPAGKGNKSIFEDLQFSQQCVKDFRMGI